MDVSLFYIRLYAVTEELPERLQPGRPYMEGMAGEWSEKVPAEGRELLERVLFLSAELFRRSLAIRDALTFEERVVLWLIRNYNCHMVIDSDGLKLNKSGNVSDVRDVAGRRLTVAEIDQVRNDMALRHANEAEGAKAMATRVRGAAEGLLATLEEIQALPFPGP